MLYGGNNGALGIGMKQILCGALGRVPDDCRTVLVFCEPVDPDLILDTDQESSSDSTKRLTQCLPVVIES